MTCGEQGTSTGLSEKVFPSAPLAGDGTTEVLSTSGDGDIELEREEEDEPLMTLFFLRVSRVQLVSQIGDIPEGGGWEAPARLTGGSEATTQG